MEPLSYVKDQRPLGLVFAVAGVFAVLGSVIMARYLGLFFLLFILVGVAEMWCRKVRLDPASQTVEIEHKHVFKKAERESIPFAEVRAVVLGDPGPGNDQSKRERPLYLELADGSWVPVTTVPADPPLQAMETAETLAAALGGRPIHGPEDVPEPGETVPLARAEARGRRVEFTEEPGGWTLTLPGRELQLYDVAGPGLLSALGTGAALWGGAHFLQGLAAPKDLGPYFITFGVGFNLLLVGMHKHATVLRTSQKERIRVKGSTVEFGRVRFSAKDIGEMTCAEGGLAVRTDELELVLAAGLTPGALPELKERLEKAASLPPAPDFKPVAPPKFGHPSGRLMAGAFAWLALLPLLVGMLAAPSQGRAYAQGAGVTVKSQSFFARTLVWKGGEVRLTILGTFREMGYQQWTWQGKQQKEWRCVDSGNVPMLAWLALFFIGFLSIPVGQAIKSVTLANWGLCVFFSGWILGPLYSVLQNL